MKSAQVQAQSRGMEKWAMDGFHNLRNHVDDETRKMFDDKIDTMLVHPKMKNLLVTASNFEPGSKPLDQITGYLKGFLAKEDQAK